MTTVVRFQDEMLLKDLLLTTKDGDWGAAAPTDGYVAYRVIRGTDFARVREGDVSSVPIRYLPERTVARRTLQPDDILIETAGGTSERPTGRSLLLTPRVFEQMAMPVTCASFARFLRVDPELADPAYIYWYLQNLYQQGMMGQHEVRHTGVGRFQYTRFAQTERIPLPLKEEQRGIAETLGALDDKIESNHRLVAAIPALIRAKVAAAVGSHPEQVAVAELASFVNGGAYTKGATGTGRMVIRIAELNSGPGTSTVYNELQVPDDKTARAGDILMSWSGSLGVYRWSLDDAIINQHIFKVLPKRYPAWLVYDRLDAVIDVFRAIARDKATTMGHIQRGHLESTTVGVPSSKEFDELDRELAAVWDRLLVADQEIRRLVRVRDVLLPELMSGRLRVPEAAETVREAIA
jgi:type I restriction enzyme S subunit